MTAALNFPHSLLKMSLSCRMEVDVETSVPAEKFHDIFSTSTITQLSSMSPAKVQAVHLLKGEWEKPGCTVSWNFYIGKFAA